MKKLLYSVSVVLLALFMSQNVNAASNGEAEVLFEESFQTDLGEFTEENADGSQGFWQWFFIYKCALADASDGVARDSRLVSPEIQLGTENNIKFSYFGSGFENMENQITMSVREVAGEWTEIKIPNISDNAWNDALISIPSEFDNKNVQIAFRFNSNQGMFCAYNLSVKGIKGGAAPAEKVDPAIAYDAAEVAYIIGDEFVAPVLSNPNNLDITYSSSDEAVATVDAEGMVTVLAEGITTIKAVSAETDKYLAGEASYILTVTKAEGGEGEATAEVLFEESFGSGLGDFTEENADGTSGFWQWFFITQSAYATGENDSRLVSPEIQLQTENTVSFSYRAMDFSDLASQVFFSIREIGGEWSDMELPVLDNDANWMDVEFAIPEEYNNKNVQIAVRYTTSDNATLCVKNLVVKGIKGTDLPTGINGVTTEDLNNNNIYDLQGRKLNKLQKGINIVNGKKIIVR